MGSLSGAVLGGFFLGVLTVVLQVALPLSLRPYRDAFVYGAVLFVLLVRPGGLVAVKTAFQRV
jgi:branched-chain amino acid transport system permease protein